MIACSKFQKLKESSFLFIMRSLTLIFFKMSSSHSFSSWVTKFRFRLSLKFTESSFSVYSLLIK